MKHTKHLIYIPFTGLGLYGGFRGNRWLRNRITVFKEFTVRSLIAQTNQNFTIWVSWRPEEKGHKEVLALEAYLVELFGRDRVIFTYHGLCFWDDKYPDDVARKRLMMSLHGSLQDLVNHIGDVEDVLMTIQPSDDCYDREMVEFTQRNIENYDGMGFTKGYIMNYSTLEISEYNPKTNPPFFTIRFKKDVFIDPFKHAEHTGPYKSHEYAPDGKKWGHIDQRGFLVGTHGENVSTYYDHPYKGEMVSQETLREFGLGDVKPLKLRYSIRKQIMKRLPHWWRRKLRYYCGELIASRVYNFLRN